MISWYAILFRSLLAVVCGALIGFERERSSKNAGIKTHALITLGATLTIIVSKYAFFDVVKYSHIVLDPSRIAAQVVSGVGFIGAGTIILRHDIVDGLTTATGLWVSAIIGLAIGAGLYQVAIIGTIIILVIYEILKPNINSKINRRVVLFVETQESLEEIQNYKDFLLKNNFKKVDFMVIKIVKNTIYYSLTVGIHDEDQVRFLYHSLMNNPQVISIERN